jgi:hypothetical protein
MKDAVGIGIGGLFWICYMLVTFPGGTILMAVSCDSNKLDGWDWVLSVVVPFYGIIKAIFSASC